MRLDLNRLAADFTVLHELLLASAARVQTHTELLPAKRAAKSIILLDHKFDFLTPLPGYWLLYPFMKRFHKLFVKIKEAGYLLI